MCYSELGNQVISFNVLGSNNNFICLTLENDANKGKSELLATIIY